jgi:hypothetical protein
VAGLNEPDPVELAARIAEVLERLGVRYLLGGSLASTALGEPRATLDVDIVADLGPDRVGPWLEGLGDEFVGDRDGIDEEVQRRGSFQLIHSPTMTRIDVFVPEWTGVNLWKWERRRRLVLDPGTGRGLDVTGPEGIVIQKLLWFRRGGGVSERQWRDVLGVLKMQRDSLDVPDLQHWADRLGMLDLLGAAYRDAGMPM